VTSSDQHSYRIESAATDSSFAPAAILCLLYSYQCRNAGCSLALDHSGLGQGSAPEAFARSRMLNFRQLQRCHAPTQPSFTDLTHTSMFAPDIEIDAWPASGNPLQHGKPSPKYVLVRRDSASPFG
jgi:hypothetical protein